MKFNKLFKNKKPLIGMIHLPALPGYPSHPGMDRVIEKALIDLNVLEEAGFDGALVENDNDQPHQIVVSSTVKEAFKKIMARVIKKAKIPIGMEIIYDMLCTIEVANEVKADFVRLDIFVDDVITKWGVIPAQAKEIMALKQKLSAKNLILLTDIQVKHAQLLQKKSLRQSAKQAVDAGSDTLIVTGIWTGNAPTERDCQIAKKVARQKPVLIGSGLNSENAKELLSIADGAIVGTSIKRGEYIDLKKAIKLKQLVSSL